MYGWVLSITNLFCTEFWALLICFVLDEALGREAWSSVVVDFVSGKKTKVCIYFFRPNPSRRDLVHCTKVQETFTSRPNSVFIKHGHKRQHQKLKDHVSNVHDADIFLMPKSVDSRKSLLGFVCFQERHFGPVNVFLGNNDKLGGRFQACKSNKVTRACEMPWRFSACHAHYGAKLPGITLRGPPSGLLQKLTPAASIKACQLTFSGAVSPSQSYILFLKIAREKMDHRRERQQNTQFDTGHYHRHAQPDSFVQTPQCGQTLGQLWMHQEMAITFARS